MDLSSIVASLGCLFIMVIANTCIRCSFDACDLNTESAFSSQIQFEWSTADVKPVRMSTLSDNGTFLWLPTTHLAGRFAYRSKCYTCHWKILRVKYKTDIVNSITLRKPILVHRDLYTVFQDDLINITCTVRNLKTGQVFKFAYPPKFILEVKREAYLVNNGERMQKGKTIKQTPCSEFG